jgi:hypothetical protein
MATYRITVEFTTRMSREVEANSTSTAEQMADTKPRHNIVYSDAE